MKLIIVCGVLNIMAKSSDLREAKENKKDEFYTQLSDIERELRHYQEQFKNKVVLCNCDDPYESNFFKYFALNFNHLELKKLICTCYDDSPIIGEQLSLFDLNYVIKPKKAKSAYKIEINEVCDENMDGSFNIADVKELIKKKANTLTLLKGNGDFRSAECIEFLNEADIVVTNPPFSLFREYVAQLIEYEKKYLIIGNQNAITYKEFFPLLKDNKVWVGYGFNMSLVYKTPYPNLLEANRMFVISKGYDPNKGYVKVPAICWFTNLDVKKRHEKLELYKRYSPENYPSYDNYDAINVDRVSDIPIDYKGIIGVPISYLDKYNPNQFKIIGMGTGDTAKQLGIKKNYRGRTDLAFTINGKHISPYFRILIQQIFNEEE